MTPKRDSRPKTRRSPHQASQETWDRVLEEVRPEQSIHRRFLYSKDCSQEEVMEHIPMEIQNMFGIQGFWNSDPGGCENNLIPVVILGPQHVDPKVRGRWGQHFNQIQKADGDLSNKLKVLVWRYGASRQERYALIERKDFIPFKQACLIDQKIASWTRRKKESGAEDQKKTSQEAEDRAFIKGLQALEDDTEKWSIDKTDSVNRYHLALEDAPWNTTSSSSGKRKATSAPTVERILKRSQYDVQHLSSFLHTIGATSNDIEMIQQHAQSCPEANYVVIVKMMEYLHEISIPVPSILSYIKHLIKKKAQLQNLAEISESSEDFVSSLADESTVTEISDSMGPCHHDVKHLEDF